MTGGQSNWPVYSGSRNHIVYIGIFWEGKKCGKPTLVMEFTKDLSRQLVNLIISFHFYGFYVEYKLNIFDKCIKLFWKINKR